MQRWGEEHKLLHAKPLELGLEHNKPVYSLASSRCSNRGVSSKATIPILAMPSITTIYIIKLRLSHEKKARRN